MKLMILFLVALAVCAQAPLKTVSMVTPGEKAVVPFPVMSELEHRLDAKIPLTGGSDPMLLLGPARTLYLPGFGAIVTQEISLVVAPAISPFRQSISPQEAVAVHKRKVDRLPLARQTAREMWTTAATMLTTVPENEQIVLALRLLYQPWEDTTGLPGQIVVEGTRKSLLTGDIQIQEQ